MRENEDRDASSPAPGRARLWPWALLLLATAARSIYPFATPRFVAEEASLYFRTALFVPWWESLTWLHVDYFALVPNLATTIAEMVPLQHAPRVTAACGLLLQLAIGSLVIHGRSEVLGGPRPLHPRRLLALAMLVGAFATPMLWATSWAGQYLLAIATVLVALEPDASFRGRGLLHRGGLVLLGGLTGLLSIAALPLFVWRWHRERSRGHLRVGLVLAACAVLQVGQYLAGYLDPERGAGMRAIVADRTAGLRAETVPQVLAWRLLARPFAGRAASAELRSWLLTGDAEGAAGRPGAPADAPPPVEAFRRPGALAFGLAGSLLLLLWWGWLATRSRLALPLAAAIAIHLALALVAGVGNKARFVAESSENARYFALVTFAVGLGLLESHRVARSRWLRLLFAALTGLLILQMAGVYASDADVPRRFRWGAEARAYAAGHQEFLRSWPRGFFLLPPHRSGARTVARPLDRVERYGTEHSPVGLDLEVVETEQGEEIRARVTGAPGRAFSLLLTLEPPPLEPAPLPFPVARVDPEGKFVPAVARELGDKGLPLPLRFTLRQVATGSWQVRLEDLPLPPLPLPLGTDSGFVLQARCLGPEGYSRAWVVTVSDPPR